MADHGTEDSPRARLLTEPWAALWREELAASDAFAQAAGRFSGRVAFLLRSDDGTDDRAVVLDIADGRCRAASGASPRDTGSVRFALQADDAVWHDILAGRDDAVVALRAGRLRLVRGTLFGLLPHLALARELLAAAGRIPTGYDDRRRA